MLKHKSSPMLCLAMTRLWQAHQWLQTDYNNDDTITNIFHWPMKGKCPLPETRVYTLTIKKQKNMKSSFAKGLALTRSQQKNVKGGLALPIVCKAKAHCGNNASVTCDGYQSYGGTGCTAADDVGVFCPNQSGVLQFHRCPVPA
jgi:hypothetical protein